MSQEVAGRISLALNSPHLRQTRDLIPVTEQKENRNRKIDQLNLAHVMAHGSQVPSGCPCLFICPSLPRICDSVMGMVTSSETQAGKDSNGARLYGPLSKFQSSPNVGTQMRAGTRSKNGAMEAEAKTWFSLAS